MRIPPFCPEIPVSELAPALAVYRDRFGFTVDWSDEMLGLAGLSRDDARIFLATGSYRAGLGNHGPAVLWLNLTSRDAVDALYQEWTTKGVDLPTAPEAKPYKLYEFIAVDADGNMLRVFYDFGWEER
jgi:uncharacterized glyoxalase superfamily protein PhnB